MVSWSLNEFKLKWQLVRLHPSRHPYAIDCGTLLIPAVSVALFQQLFVTPPPSFLPLPPPPLTLVDRRQIWSRSWSGVRSGLATCEIYHDNSFLTIRAFFFFRGRVVAPKVLFLIANLILQSRIKNADQCRNA